MLEASGDGIAPVAAVTLGSYLVGWAVLSATLGPAGWAAVEVRRWLLAAWRGPWARLAEVVAAAVMVTVVAEGLGTVGQLRRVPLVLAGAVVGGGLALAVRRLPRRPGPPPEPPAPVDGWALAGAGVVVAAVGAQWAAFTALAFRQGITAYDAVFYHGPVAARFAQTASVSGLHDIVPGEAVAFYPFNTETWHALGMVAFHSDVVSPVLNLGALVVALLAAWCLGRRFGGAPAAVAGVALVATVPYMALTQPGSSFNDFPALAAMLAAAALLSRAPADRAAAGFAALAAGLAAGIKLSFLAPAGLLAIAAVLLVPRGRRLAAAAGWAILMFVAGGYWYVRNLVRVGNPLPELRVAGLPGPSLPVDTRYGRALLTGLDLSRRGWQAVYQPGLRSYFGRAWPGLVAMVVVAVVVGIAAGRGAPWQRPMTDGGTTGLGVPWHRAMAAVVAASVVAYAITPGTGDPAFFGFNLRYSLAAQGLAACVLATTAWLRGRWAQRGLVALVALGVALSWPGPPAGRADPFEMSAWPAGAGHRLAAVAAAAAILALAGAGWALWQMAAPALWPAYAPEGDAHRRWARARRLRPAVAAGSAGAVLVAGIVAGRGIDDRYQAGRYRHQGGSLGAAWAWAQGVRGARIGVVGVYQQYPFTGADLSNFVQYVGVATPHHGFARAPSCQAWRAAVDAGRYRFVVTSRDGIFPPPGEPPEAAWTRSDPSAHQILRVGSTAVFALSGPLDPAGC